MRSASKNSAQPEPKRLSTLFTRALAATSSASVALSRSGPRNAKVRWKLPSLLSTTPGATSAAHGKWSTRRAARERYSRRCSIRGGPAGADAGRATARQRDGAARPAEGTRPGPASEGARRAQMPREHRREVGIAPRAEHRERVTDGPGREPGDPLLQPEPESGGERAVEDGDRPRRAAEQDGLD